MVELPLDGLEVRENVRVIELEVAEDQRARPVVHELGALVEEGRVVLVGLDHEKRCGAEPRGDAEIGRDAADQEAGLQARRLEQERKDAGGGGLAVRAGHRQGPAVVQHLARQPLRARAVRQAGIEQPFDDRQAAPHDVAHHHAIGRGRQQVVLVALDHLDPELCELGAHGRIERAVGPGHPMAPGARQRRHARHECPADAEDMDVHQSTGKKRRNSATLMLKYATAVSTPAA
jgi:hypothetical protein